MIDKIKALFGFAPKKELDEITTEAVVALAIQQMNDQQKLLLEQMDQDEEFAHLSWPQKVAVASDPLCPATYEQLKASKAQK